MKNLLSTALTCISVVLSAGLLASCNAKDGKVISGYKLEQHFTLHPPEEEMFITAEGLDFVSGEDKIEDIIKINAANGNYYALKYDKDKTLNISEKYAKIEEIHTTVVFWVKIRVEAQEDCLWPNCKGLITEYRVLDKKFVGILGNERK